MPESTEPLNAAVREAVRAELTRMLGIHAPSETIVPAIAGDALV
jgi:hypothetical protein